MRLAMVSALLAVRLAAAASAEPARLTGRDAGLYVGTAAGYLYGRTPFAFDIAQVSRHTDPAGLREHVERLHSAGVRPILDIFLYDKPDETARPAAEYLALIERCLSRTNVDHVYAITLSEENIYWFGRGEMLAELYRLVKAKYPTLAVYQWYSPGASPPGFGWPLLPADGWLIDEYCMPPEQFENLVRKYLLLDRPLIHIAWAAPGWKEFATWDQVWEGQLEVCRRYDVPIAFFCWWPPNSDPAPPGNQSMWSWSAPPGTEHHRVWHQQVLPYVERLRQGLPAAGDPDRCIGRGVPVAGDLQGKFAYHEDFSTTAKLADDGDIIGFRGLRWVGRRLEAKPGRRATITYRFESPFTMHDVQAEVLGDGPPRGLELSLSTDGRRWLKALEGRPLKLSLPAADTPARRCLVRLELASSVEQTAAVAHWVLTARVDPPAVPQIALTADADGRMSFTDDYRSQLYLHAGRVEHPEQLDWQTGRVGLHGANGRVDAATIDYHCVAERALRDIVVGLACAADRRDYGSTVALSLSADGQQFGEPVTTADKDPFRGELTAKWSGPAPVREFWVRVTLTNSCGKAVSALTPSLQRLTVRARAAE